MMKSILRYVLKNQGPPPKKSEIQDEGEKIFLALLVGYIYLKKEQKYNSLLTAEKEKEKKLLLEYADRLFEFEKFSPRNEILDLSQSVYDLCFTENALLYHTPKILCKWIQVLWEHGFDVLKYFHTTLDDISKYITSNDIENAIELTKYRDTLRKNWLKFKK